MSGVALYSCSGMLFDNVVRTFRAVATLVSRDERPGSQDPVRRRWIWRRDVIYSLVIIYFPSLHDSYPIISLLEQRLLPVLRGTVIADAASYGTQQFSGRSRWGDMRDDYLRLAIILSALSGISSFAAPLVELANRLGGSGCALGPWRAAYVSY